MIFKVLYRRAARESFKEGVLTQEQYAQLMEVLRHPLRKKLRSNEKINLLNEVEKYTNKNIGKQGAGWDAVLQWLKDHWVDILKLLLSLLVLLEPPPKDK